MANDNIFQQYLAPPKSVMDYTTELDQADARRNALQMSALSLQNAADVGRQRNALRAAVTSGNINLSNPDHIDRALTLAPDVAPALLKSVQDSATSRALAAKDSGAAGKSVQETADLAHAALFKNLGMVNTPEDAHQWALQGLRTHVFTPEQYVAGIQKIPSDPAQFDQWKQQAMVGGQALNDQISATTPKPTEVKLGNRVAFIDMNPRSKTYGQESAPAQTVGQSPDSVASNATSIRTTGMNNATSIANNRATIAKDYKVNGMDANGNFIGSADGVSPFKGLVDEIGTNQTPQSVALARMSPGIRSQILAEVRKNYPDYDVANFSARNAAIKNFTDPNSKTAIQLQASNTALNHLDTFQQLADAQKNGQWPLFNKIANNWATQTGQAVPKNLKDAALMIGPEISKAVVGAGGGVGERGDFVHSLGGDYSPDQIAGTVATMKELLGGRLAEAERTYQRSTGRKDFRSDAYLSPAAQAVLNARGAAAPASAAPTAIAPAPLFDPAAIAAELKKRGH